MKDRIEISNKSDRDLLVLAVHATNQICDRLDMLNNSVAENTKRSVENKGKIIILISVISVILTTLGGIIAYLIFIPD